MSVWDDAWVMCVGVWDVVDVGVWCAVLVEWVVPRLGLPGYRPNTDGWLVECRYIVNWKIMLDLR